MPNSPNRPGFTFRQRCEAASAAGFAQIGIHLNDTTVKPTDVADILSVFRQLDVGEAAARAFDAMMKFF